MFNGLEFKDDVDPGEYEMLSMTLYPLIGFYLSFCYEHDLDCKITSLVNDYKGKRVSRSHAEMRAADLSVMSWSEFMIEKFVFEGNKKFKSVAAVSKRDGKPRAFVYHNGSGWHIHAQVKQYIKGY